ncbi:ABC transporter ATP-binding protein [Sporosalibacterium faouarense]|uniref:ABC transporter ATP-binding protein n=1 Tax=Sporosalibacterium faouarense TaxID=516123 RepID=UPI00192AE174|nr:ABC transporter ATP-binding protein [Sporosalibacterium faouarense]
MKAIEVYGLKKEYNSIVAVDDISFSVEEGSIFGMLGPNGAGKSTTIECIIGLRKKDNGDVKILGLDPIKDNSKLYNLIGVQLQETSYQDKIRVSELCDLFMSMYDEPLDYIPLLERFGLLEKKKNYMSELSGGQRQKIAIILALIANPKIVFLDELTTGLDPKARREMWKCIRELRDEGRTIFMTTHYLEEAEYLCDEICIINNGEIVAIDNISGIIDRANIDIIVSFETKEEVASLIKENITGVSKIERLNNMVKVYSKRDDIISDIVILLRNKNIDYSRIDVIRPTLEDAYLKLTGKEWEVK